MPPRPARFLCIGALHQDLIARAEAPLAPGADVPGRVERRPGGVTGNVARALAARGAEVAILAAIGDDPEGRALAARLEADGVATRWLTRGTAATDSYVGIETAEGELFAGIADCRALEAAGADILAPLADPGFPAPTCLVLDGNLPAEVLAALARMPATGAADPVVVAASPEKSRRLGTVIERLGATVFANRAEAGAILSREFPDAAMAARALLALAPMAIVTDGPRPAALALRSSGAVFTVRPLPAPRRSVTGAGDAFLAGFLLADRGGRNPQACLDAAAEAARRHIAGEKP